MSDKQESENPQGEIEAALRALVDLKDIEARINKSGANYEDVRAHRRENDAAWKRARELIYGPPEVDNKPLNKQEADRWAKRAKASAASRSTAA